MSATATITTKVVNNVIAVPLQAVVEKKPIIPRRRRRRATLRSPSTNRKPSRASTSSKATKRNSRKSRPASSVNPTAQITSGLEAGEEVITGPSRILNTLKDGAVVKKQVKKEGEAANK